MVVGVVAAAVVMVVVVTGAVLVVVMGRHGVLRDPLPWHLCRGWDWWCGTGVPGASTC